MLIKAGVYIDERDYGANTPLHAAAVRGKVEMLEYLLSKGADANKRNLDGDTPLAFAEKSKHHKVIKILKNISGN